MSETEGHNSPEAGGAAKGRSNVPHHFDSARQHYESNILGMWIFLVTEIMMFGGLFCGYAVYRAKHPEIFIYAHQFLDTRLGGLNTVVLITSSLTMAWAVRSAQLGRRRELVLCLALTFLLGGCFLGVKYVEYSQKWRHGMLWGQKFQPHGEPGMALNAQPSSNTVNTPVAAPSVTAAATSAAPAEATAGFPAPGLAPQGLAVPAPETVELMQRPKNVHLFFGIYFAMTGLHALHILIGMGLMLWLLVLSAKGRFSAGYFIPVDQVGLYWHLVDLIWIFLFPLLYLIR